MTTIMTLERFEEGATEATEADLLMGYESTPNGTRPKALAGGWFLPHPTAPTKTRASSGLAAATGRISGLNVWWRALHLGFGGKCCSLGW